MNTAGDIDRAVRILDEKQNELLGRGRSVADCQTAGAARRVGVERYGVSLKSFAESFWKSRITVSAWVSRGAKKRARSDRFREEVEKLDRGIADG